MHMGCVGRIPVVHVYIQAFQSELSDRLSGSKSPCPNSLGFCHHSHSHIPLSILYKTAAIGEPSGFCIRKWLIGQVFSEPLTQNPRAIVQGHIQVQIWVEGSIWEESNGGVLVK